MRARAQAICTECFAQIKQPRAVHVQCPFCNKDDYSVTFTGPLSDAAILKQQTEEQEVISLQIKMREEEIERDRLRSEERERRRLEGGDDDQSSAPAPAMPPTPEGPAAPTAAHTDWAAPGIGGGAHYEYEEGAPALDAAAIFGHHGQR